MPSTITKRLLAAFSSMIFTAILSAQVENVDFLRTGTQDGIKILQAYIAPWANALGAAVNGNWYNTAKPHKFGGFDITVGASAGFIPKSENKFDVSKIGLTTFKGSGMASTVSGLKQGGVDLTGPTINGVPPVIITTPGGMEWNIMPVPSLQAGIGLPLGSEVKIRYTPEIKVNDGKFSSWGLGLLHSITQYFPGDKISPLDVSIFGGYNKLKGDVPLNLQPDHNMPQNYSSKYPAGSFDNQMLAGEVEVWNASLIASLNLKIISFYGGLGYSKTSTTINMTGNFPLPTVNTAISTTSQVYEDAGVLKDFPALEVKNFSGVRTNIGFRLKFAVVTFHADYTWANYSVVSTGLGISIR